MDIKTIKAIKTWSREWEYETLFYFLSFAVSY